MTFSLPSELAQLFVRRVAARDRSRYLAQVLERSLREEESELIRSCMLANDDPDARLIEREWDRMRDPIEEPWIDSPPR